MCNVHLEYLHRVCVLCSTRVWVHSFDCSWLKTAAVAVYLYQYVLSLYVVCVFHLYHRIRNISVIITHRKKYFFLYSYCLTPHSLIFSLHFLTWSLWTNFRIYTEYLCDIVQCLVLYFMSQFPHKMPLKTQTTKLMFKQMKKGEKKCNVKMSN